MRAIYPPDQEQHARQREATLCAAPGRRGGARVTRLAVGTPHREHRQRVRRGRRTLWRWQYIGAGRRARRPLWCSWHGPAGEHTSDSTTALSSGEARAAARTPPAPGGAPPGESGRLRASARLSLHSHTTADVPRPLPCETTPSALVLPHAWEGATLVAPATSVASAAGPRLPGLAQHGDVSPAMGRRRGQGLLGARVLANCVRVVAQKRRG
jgi:hypothetical protein